jgi:hypothetical protein
LLFSQIVLYYSQRVREEPPAKKNNMKNKTRFLNATIKVKRNPEYKGNHEIARTDNFRGCTYPLGTTEQEMIDEFHGQKIGIIKGKTWLMGEMVRVERVECFEDKG